jgi:hypothetical protein
MTGVLWCGAVAAAAVLVTPSAAFGADIDTMPPKAVLASVQP